MASLVFLGDDVAAAGWRLAGVEALAVPPAEASKALARALDEADLVIVSADTAARIPEAQLRAAIRRLAPLTVVVPDLRETVPYPDVAARLKRQLGIES